MSSSCLALQHEIPGNLRATFRDVLQVFLVVPHGFEAADSAEGSELDEEVGIQVEKLHHQIIVAVGSGAIDGRCIPPLFSRTLPAKRQVWRHCTGALKRTQVYFQCSKFTTATNFKSATGSCCLDADSKFFLISVSKCS